MCAPSPPTVDNPMGPLPIAVCGAVTAKPVPPPLDAVYSGGVTVCEGICDAVRVTVSTPPASPRVRVVSPVVSPVPMGMRDLMSGSVNEAPADALPNAVPMTSYKAGYKVIWHSAPLQNKYPSGGSRSLPAYIKTVPTGMPVDPGIPVAPGGPVKNVEHGSSLGHVYPYGFL